MPSSPPLTPEQLQADWVIPAVADLLDLATVPLDAPLNAETVLFGKTGLLSSIQLVMLTVALEQQIEDATGTALTLADEKAMSQGNSPFKTIGSLSHLIAQRLQPVLG
jgi:D-alanine--poly(phosphoribitol) ligase subunit 2